MNNCSFYQNVNQLDYNALFNINFSGNVDCIGFKSTRNLFHITVHNTYYMQLVITFNLIYKWNIV